MHGRKSSNRRCVAFSVFPYLRTYIFPQGQTSLPRSRHGRLPPEADNLQVWNEEIAPLRRYAIIRLSEQNVVTTVRVATGEELALLDRTGTLTQKYQAKRSSDEHLSALNPSMGLVAELCRRPSSSGIAPKLPQKKTPAEGPWRLYAGRFAGQNDAKVRCTALSSRHWEFGNRPHGRI